MRGALTFGEATRLTYVPSLCPAFLTLQLASPPSSCDAEIEAQHRVATLCHHELSKLRTFPQPSLS